MLFYKTYFAYFYINLVLFLVDYINISMFKYKTYFAYLYINLVLFLVDYYINISMFNKGLTRLS